MNNGILYFNFPLFFICVRLTLTLYLTLTSCVLFFLCPVVLMLLLFFIWAKVQSKSVRVGFFFSGFVLGFGWVSFAWVTELAWDQSVAPGCWLGLVFVSSPLCVYFVLDEFEWKFRFGMRYFFLLGLQTWFDPVLWVFRINANLFSRSNKFVGFPLGLKVKLTDTTVVFLMSLSGLGHEFWYHWNSFTFNLTNVRIASTAEPWPIVKGQSFVWLQALMMKSPLLQHLQGSVIICCSPVGMLE